MLLHAWRLDLVHPATGAPLGAVAPLDAEWERALGLFGWNAGMLTARGLTPPPGARRAAAPRERSRGAAHPGGQLIDCVMYAAVREG
jgi:hypothetical protein